MGVLLAAVTTGDLYPHTPALRGKRLCRSHQRSSHALPLKCRINCHRRDAAEHPWLMKQRDGMKAQKAGHHAVFTNRHPHAAAIPFIRPQAARHHGSIHGIAQHPKQPRQGLLIATLRLSDVELQGLNHLAGVSHAFDSLSKST